MVVWKRRMFHTDRGSDPEFNACAAASTTEPVETRTMLGPIKPLEPDPPVYFEMVVNQKSPDIIAAPSAESGYAQRASWRRMHLRPGAEPASPQDRKTMAG